MFAYRHRRTAADLALAARQEGPVMKVAITGASGLIGRALSSYLTTAGHTVVPLVRRAPQPGEVRWDPRAGTVDTAGLRGVDAVVHLAAEPIEARPLTAEKRRRLRDSRVEGTRTLAEALARTDDGPRVLLSASGSNVYGDRGQPAGQRRSAHRDRQALGGSSAART
jgi:NAD dependent epimerase/dehydratase family enzyme